MRTRDKPSEAFTYALTGNDLISAGQESEGRMAHQQSFGTHGLWATPPGTLFNYLADCLGPRDWLAMQLVCKPWHEEARLCLKRCTPLRPEVLKEIENLPVLYPNLTCVDVSQLDGVTMAALATLNALTGLKELTLGDVVQRGKDIHEVMSPTKKQPGPTHASQLNNPPLDAHDSVGPSSAPNDTLQSPSRPKGTGNKVTLYPKDAKAMRGFYALLKRLTALHASLSPAITPQVLSDLKGLHDLTLDSLAGLGYVTPLINLTHLRILRLPTTEQSMVLNNLTSLRSLCLSTEWLDLSELLASVTALSHLTHLALRTAKSGKEKKSARAVNAPPSFPCDWEVMTRLESLELRASPDVLAPQLPRLHHLPALTQLTVELNNSANSSIGRPHDDTHDDGADVQLNLFVPPSLDTLSLGGDKSAVAGLINVHLHAEGALKNMSLRLYWCDLNIIPPKLPTNTTPTTSSAPRPRRPAAAPGLAPAEADPAGDHGAGMELDPEEGHGAEDGGPEEPRAGQPLHTMAHTGGPEREDGADKHGTDGGGLLLGGADGLHSTVAGAGPPGVHGAGAALRTADGAVGPSGSTSSDARLGDGDEASEAGGEHGTADTDLDVGLMDIPAVPGLALQSLAIDACFRLSPVSGLETEARPLHAVPRVLWLPRVVGTLSCLVLEGSLSVTDEDIWAMTTLSQLTQLTVSGCHHITDHGLAAVGELSRLSSLTVAGMCDPTGALAQAYAKVRQVARLAENISGSFLAALSNCHGLKQLCLRQLQSLKEDLLSSGLSQLKHLSLLEIHECPAMSDSVMSNVVAQCLTCLTQLTVTHSQRVTEVGRSAVLSSFGMGLGMTLDGCRVRDVTRGRGALPAREDSGRAGVHWVRKQNTAPRGDEEASEEQGSVQQPQQARDVDTLMLGEMSDTGSA